MCIRAASKILRVVSTTRQTETAGFYNLVPDQQANGMPVWKCGKMWLYSTTNGEWCFASADDHIGIGKDFAVQRGWIISTSHGGLMPNAVAGWHSFDGYGWPDDTGISVTIARDSGARVASATRKAEAEREQERKAKDEAERKAGAEAERRAEVPAHGGGGAAAAAMSIEE
eukprot:gene19496-biopygen36865